MTDAERLAQIRERADLQADYDPAEVLRDRRWLLARVEALEARERLMLMHNPDLDMNLVLAELRARVEALERAHREAVVELDAVIKALAWAGPNELAVRLHSVWAALQKGGQ